MNEIREAMNSGNVEAVSTVPEELNAALNEFKNVHQSVQVLLDEEERKSDNDDWYLPKMQNFETFLKEVATWKIVQKDLQAVISPSDSISNVSHSKMKSSRSIASSSSRTTSVSSARLRAKAEKAALLQRAEGLKKKHALELERIEVQNVMERVELETELAAVDAKVRGYKALILNAWNLNSYHQKGLSLLEMALISILRASKEQMELRKLCNQNPHQ